MSEPLLPRQLRAGQKHYVKGITIEIMEVNEIKAYAGSSDRVTVYMVSYRLRDGDFISPVAHLFIPAVEDARKYFLRVVDEYLRNREWIKQMLRR